MKGKKQFIVKYWDGCGDLVSILLYARNMEHCLQIFRRMYGEYYIEEVKECRLTW